MLMARVPGAKKLARNPRSRGRNTYYDVTRLPVERNVPHREPRRPILTSAVSMIAPAGTLSGDTERTVKSASRANVPAGSGCAATKYPIVTGAGGGAGVFSVT